jgi:hypothetical protein
MTRRDDFHPLVRRMQREDRLKVWASGLVILAANALLWGSVAWFVVYVAWPWLAAILRANGVKGV